MHLINRHRTIEPSALSLPLLHPLMVAPRVSIEIPDDGRSAAVGFEEHTVGIAFLKTGAVHARSDLVFVAVTVAHLGNERLPDATHTETAHRMGLRIPSVEIADDAHLFGVGRPHREVHAGAAVELAAVRAKLVISAMQGAFTKKMQIEFREHASVLHFHGAFGDELRRAADPHTRNSCRQPIR